MTFTQLQILVAVIEAGGFTAAAARLGIGQSAVSHALRALEKSLGATLIDRRQSPPVATDVCRRLLPLARGTLAQADSLRREAAASKGLAGGVLRVGSFGPTTSLKLLPNLIAEFSRRYPGVEVHVDEGADEVVDQWLTERRIDLGFVVLPDHRFETVPLAQDEFVAVLPERHPLARLSQVPVAALDGVAFAMTAAGSQVDILQLLEHAGAHPRVLFRLPQLTSILGVVERALAVSIVARLALPDRHPHVVYRPLRPKAIRRIALAMRNESELSPAARAFVTLARKIGSKLASPRL